jgi:cytochrome c peroxidase
MKTSRAFNFAFIGLLLANCTTKLDEAKVVTLELPAEAYNYAVGVNNDLPTLGRVLFYDRQLSINNSVSCSSCHKQELGFADNVKFSTGFGAQMTTRNSMPIQNLGNGFVGAGSAVDFIVSPTNLFWDGREHDLNVMVLKPLVNHVEMGVNDIASFTKKVSQIPYYQDLFIKAYGDPTVTSERVANALTWFVRSINTKNTKFDAHTKAMGLNFLGFVDNTTKPIDAHPVLSPLEAEGWKLFLEKYNCNSCHQVQAPSGYAQFGGSFANIGLDRQYADNGLSGVTKRTADAGKFKIPSLRNVALTAPYMHDGRFETLGDVIDHYKDGIANHPNLDPRLRNSDGTARVMSITDNEKAALIAFLHTLTDITTVTDPKLSNPFKEQ